MCSRLDGFCKNKGFDWKISCKIIIIKRWVWTHLLKAGGQVARSAPDRSSSVKLWSRHFVSAEQAEGMVTARPTCGHLCVLGLGYFSTGWAPFSQMGSGGRDGLGFDCADWRCSLWCRQRLSTGPRDLGSIRSPLSGSITLAKSWIVLVPPYPHL